MNSSNKADLVVIGAGPGGYTAAFLAADLGMQVTLVDPEAHPGGVCLYRGCIPSKTLLHVARLLEEFRGADQWGITVSTPDVDISRLRLKTATVVETLTSGLGQLCRRRKITYIRGAARFTGSETVEITETEGEKYALDFQHAIIATGSDPISLPSLAIDSPHMMNATDALSLKTIPRTLIVVGGGYIGLELGTVYAALGSEVTLVETLPGLLWGVDRDLVRVLGKKTDHLFSAIRVNTKVISAEKTEAGIRCRFSDEAGAVTEQTVEAVLVAVGRHPHLADLGLENTAVEVDADGFIHTNYRKQTTDPRIYAVGDVAGQPMLAHKASHEGRVAAEAIAGQKAAFDPRAIPAVVFTDPEIAWCGLTETQAKAEKRPYQVARFPWAASGRALTQARTDGLTKLIIDPETQQILGMGIVGAGAGELIAEGVLAIEMAALASDIRMTVHPHPTLSETVMEAAEVFFGQSTHVYRPRRKKR